MKNKIGISELQLRMIEHRLINQKLNLLDETFTFNESEYNFKYLVLLNDFLFRDFYYNEEIGIRNLNLKEVGQINKYLRKITYLCINKPNEINQILSLVEEIWHLQPFIVGNTRTMIAYLKIISESFLLQIDVDVNREIVSSPNMFKLNNIVNQKRLTKLK